MKKNISINISGIIFYIEEDGYDRLKLYLDEIKRYFATYDDTGEIAADIENRVAEIFLSKLNPGKQVLTADDVDSLIAQMGNVQDFEAIQEPESTESSYAYSSYENTYTEANAGAGAGTAGAAGAAGAAGTASTTTASRRLYRDGKHKILGGVAAGIAHYLRVDPIWIRLLFVAILLDLFITFSFSSVLLIGYIILWIVVPERYDLREDKKMKKMFRDPDNKVIGGVASGLAAYFGVDPTIIRILFIVFTFIGGSGLIAYLVLWVITPEATTLTDRMQMQGEPVTLSNIEQNIKKNLNVKEGEENALVKLLLLPFRLIAAVFAGLGRLLSPLVSFLGDAIRILAGIALILAGFFFLLSLVAGVSFISGAFPEVYLDLFDLHFPAMVAGESVPTALTISSFIALFIPGLAAILLGIAVIAKRWVLPSTASWLLFAFWVISLITTAVTIPAFAADFKTSGFYESESTFATDTTQSLLLTVAKEDQLQSDDVELTIKPTQEAQMRLAKRFYARGRNKDAAVELASQTQFEVSQKGNTLAIDQHISLPENVPYRAQSLDATLYMPVGQKFKMDYSMRRILSNTLTPHGFRVSDLRKTPTFFFNESGELKCLDCPEKEVRQGEKGSENKWGEDWQGNYTREIKADDFREISVGSHYELELRQAAEYSILLKGDEDAVNTVEFDQSGRHISFKNAMQFFDSDKGKVRILISLPELEALKLSGSSETRMENWSAQEMEIDLSGSSELRLEGEINTLAIEQSGSSKSELRGKGQSLSASLSGSSELNAFDFPLQEASLNMSGASDAAVAPAGQLKVNASGASQVQYRGNPTTNINKSRGADVQKED